jgi:hypothetical protein
MDVEAHGVAQNFSDVLRFDKGATVASVERGEGRNRGGFVTTMKQDPADGGLDGATPGITTDALDYFFISITVILHCKRV